MLLIEVLSNDEGSVIEDAKFSAKRQSPPSGMPQPAGSHQAKTVPKPYTPTNGGRPEAAAASRLTEGVLRQSSIDKFCTQSCGCL